jgi:RNA polymerase sigma factor (sigma-70 family)
MTVTRATAPDRVELPPFQALLDAHGRDVHRLLVATVGRGDAEDCYQEAWLAALRAYPRLRDASNLRSWILTIAHNKALDHIRSARRRAVPVAELPELAAPGRPGVAHPASSEGELWDRVRALPDKQRTAVALRFIGDLTHAEIARIMDTSEAAARRSVHEAIKQLRQEHPHED